jgi:hypothetical protein
MYGLHHGERGEMRSRKNKADEGGNLMLPIIGALLPVVGKVLDRIIPDVAEREKAKIELQLKLAEQEGELMKALIQSDVAQAEINKKDAESGDRFKSYARPTAIWICVSGFAFSVFMPYISWGLSLLGVQIISPPPLPSEVLNTMLFGLLGLGAYRTYEKKNGVTK